MKNHLIYQDNDIKVEILGEFHDMLKKFLAPIKINRLSETQFNILLKCILELLNKEHFPIKGKKVISCSQVPILIEGQYVEMAEMFSDFSFAFQTLSYECKATPEIKDYINEHYAAENIDFFTNFFETPAYNVSGFFAMIKENNILITLFTLDENREDSD